MTDLLVNNENDLSSVDADLVVGESNSQHMEHLLITMPATIIEDESIGIDAESFLNDDDIDGMLNKIQEQYTKDGVVLNTIQFDEQTGDLITDGNYPN
jgi:hypothetical protein